MLRILSYGCVLGSGEEEVMNPVMNMMDINLCFHLKLKGCFGVSGDPSAYHS